MHYAAKANDPGYLDVVLAHEADPNTPNAVTRATPLVSALMANRDVHFRKLLTAGASATAADRLGNTPLHMAAKINAYDRVLDLLRAGADPLARNRQGLTFQHYLDLTPSDRLSADARRRKEVIAVLATRARCNGRGIAQALISASSAVGHRTCSSGTRNVCGHREDGAASTG